MLVRIIAPWFVAGVVIGERVAPIVHYVRTWNLEAIRKYCDKRKWKMEICS